MKNNTNRIVCLVLYILSLIALTAYIIYYQIIDVKNPSVWQIIARIGGGLINYNFAVAICLMLKQTMTIIRRIYFLRLLIPVDDHIDAHRLVGTVLFISAVVHTVGHTVHFAVYTDSKYLSLLLMNNLICLISTFMGCINVYNGCGNRLVLSFGDDHW
jgi:cytochrome c oxidase assembly factor CtaG